MTVKELIEHLKTFDENLPVWYELHSDTVAMDKEQVTVTELGIRRASDDYATPTGRYPRESQTWNRFKAVLFPGN